MTFKPELVKKVKDYFNLNIYETKVWLSLLTKGIASAGEIAELSGVPRSRTYDVLESLEKQGFAIAKIGKPVKYIAVKPNMVIDKLKTNIVKNADEKVEILAGLKSTKEYSELEDLHKTALAPIKQSEMSGAIKGKLNINSHIREMLSNSEKEVILCMPALELESKSRIFSDLFEKLRKANVKLNLALSGQEADIKRAEQKFRVKSQKLDMKGKFFISDRKQVLLMVNNSEDEETGIWLESDFFANSLASLFDVAVKR